MKTYFDGLLEMNDKEDLNEVMKNLPYEQAFNLLYEILSLAVINGGYNLDEGYIIHQCFVKIKKNEDKTK